VRPLQRVAAWRRSGRRLSSFPGGHSCDWPRVCERHLSSGSVGLIGLPVATRALREARSADCASDALFPSLCVVRVGRSPWRSLQRPVSSSYRPQRFAASALRALTDRRGTSREVSRFGVPFGVCGPRRTVRGPPACGPSRYDVRLPASAPKPWPTRVLAVFSASRLRGVFTPRRRRPVRVIRGRSHSAAHVPGPAGPFSRLGRTRPPATPMGFSSFPSQC
jgi:hypothetical protein